MKRAEPYLRWLPALAWATILLILSGEAGGTDTTLFFLERVLPVDMAPETFRLIHLLIRKSGHLLAYGLLGFLNLRALRGRPLLAIALAAAIAIVDEWHQAYVPMRTGTPADVLIDVVGASLAVTAASLRDRHRVTR